MQGYLQQQITALKIVGTTCIPFSQKGTDKER
jgi:hypothetical protein